MIRDNTNLKELRPRIIVMGVGGAGGNAVNNMITSGLEGVEFIVANTDAQALSMSGAHERIQLGVHLTEGLGAGSNPDIGEGAAEEALEDLKSRIRGAHMLFIACGMGGGTGTGAAPVVARIAQELGILTVAVVTKPFNFEGQRRMRMADKGIEALKDRVDTMIVIPNQNLFRLANEKTSFAEAFQLADQVLNSGVCCVTDLIMKEGLINLDFADVKTVINEMGAAMMGTGLASGEDRARKAAEGAIANPLIDDISLKGARGLLISISGGQDMTLYEVDEVASRIRQEVDPEANIIVGATFDESLSGKLMVSLVASGLKEMRHGMPGAGRGPAVQGGKASMSGAQLQNQTVDGGGIRNLGPQSQSTPPPMPAPNEEQNTYPRHEAGISPDAGSVTISQQPPRFIQGEMQAGLPTSTQSSTDPQSQQPGFQGMIGDNHPPVNASKTASSHSGHHKGQVSQKTENHSGPDERMSLRRPPRRMPNLDELPIVAQHQIKAKEGMGPEQGLETHKKKAGFLERLSRLGTAPSDSNQNESVVGENHRQVPNTGANQPVQQQRDQITAPPAPSKPMAPPVQVPQNDVSHRPDQPQNKAIPEGQHIDIPDFFKRSGG